MCREACGEFLGSLVEAQLLPKGAGGSTFYLKELEAVRLDTRVEPVLTGLYRREAVVPALLTFFSDGFNILDDHGGDRVQLD